MLPPPDHGAFRHLPYQAGTSASPQEGNKARIEGWLAKPQGQALASPSWLSTLTWTELHDLTCSNSAHCRKN